MSEKTATERVKDRQDGDYNAPILQEPKSPNSPVKSTK